MLTALVLTAALAADAVPTDSGALSITPIGHGTLVLEHEGVRIWVDPWSQVMPAEVQPADIVLITDIHPDHLDPAALARVRTAKTQVVAPQAVADALPATAKPQVILANGDKKTLGTIGIEAVPMYNLTRGPEPGKLFHERGRGNGYVLTVGGKRIYIAGDTACTDEMKALTAIDVAFVPMNLPYTMPPEEAAVCIAAFDPAILYPYHYKGSDLAVLAKALAGEPVEVRLRDWYRE